MVRGSDHPNNSVNYCENEEESLNKVYAIKSKFSRDYIDDIWNELKGKNLVHYESDFKPKTFSPYSNYF